MNENLVTVSTYAKMKDVAVQTVYLWIKTDKVKVTVIDGVQFINLKENE